MEQNQEIKIPTEVIGLPSRGLLYPKDNPLSSGQVEMKYMTAQHEDILTNQNYIKQGIVLDKLFQSLIVSKINYDDLLIGDKNAILIAARVLGYGKDYTFEYENPTTGEKEKTTLDISRLDAKPLKTDLITPNVNEFSFTLPTTQIPVTFKLLTHKDENNIDAEVKGLQKINPNSSTVVTTRLKHTLTSVNGNRETKYIRDFVDNYLIARDSQALRKYIKELTPDINFTFYPEGAEEGVEMPITVDFFWPKS